MGVMVRCPHTFGPDHVTLPNVLNFKYLIQFYINIAMTVPIQFIKLTHLGGIGPHSTAPQFLKMLL